ncbi:hypothetical protein VOLCADRAFT_92202 [Volvox carteri f. nagariensis]|uniref:Cyclin-like domain-containing protein n=1 Tax=Volvox carteri f. nagariensis TaxID=3068 RepID=D8TYV8_VOLCA|nr:uncharacterized protein VOLCADRAFT_92202 [Volvox carteri f. nagariensis]EFJ47460.1 hypothetical protein VOLCADRAFT_92202 [Volvox carteri f. nagariensis]|eukprot:XP_002951649.1 hypothetical protein VOLCADRAFT_92202 [Volvox carteri f. nagariensis]
MSVGNTLLRNMVLKRPKNSTTFRWVVQVRSNSRETTTRATDRQVRDVAAKATKQHDMRVISVKQQVCDAKWPGKISRPHAILDFVAPNRRRTNAYMRAEIPGMPFFVSENKQLRLYLVQTRISHQISFNEIITEVILYRFLIAGQDYPINLRTSMLSVATPSPGSCASTSAFYFGASTSSSCLTCTEVDAFDADLRDVDAFCEETPELCGSCTNALRFEGLPSEKQVASSPELCRLIRIDLDKQRDAARTKMPAPLPLASDAPRGFGADAISTIRRLPAQHRALMVGWMRQVSSALRLQLSTLFTATSILDRFVAVSEALPPDGLLQLLALTSMSIAVKYNEVGQVAPTVWLGLAVDPMGQRLYTPRDLQRYEFTLLQAIDWRLNDPTVFTFLEHFLACQQHRGREGHPGAWQPLPQGHSQPQPQPEPQPQYPLEQPSGASEPYSSSAASAAATGSEPEAIVAGPAASGPIGRHAAMLAELTLVYDNFLSYDNSTVALACVLTAERLALGAGSSDSGQQQLPLPLPMPPLLSQAAAAVVAVSSLKLEWLAPGLGPCVEAVEKFCVALQPAETAGLRPPQTT